MSASPNGSPHHVLDDAARRTETVLGAHLEDGNFAGRAKDAVRTEIAALRSARALADRRAKLAEPDMGGTTLDLSDADDAQKLRALLAFVAEILDEAGGPVLVDETTLTAADARAFRKRINAGVSRTAERRTPPTPPSPAEASL